MVPAGALNNGHGPLTVVCRAMTEDSWTFGVTLFDGRRSYRDGQWSHRCADLAGALGGMPEIKFCLRSAQTTRHGQGRLFEVVVLTRDVGDAKVHAVGCDAGF